ncbi:MAG: hypothetical protein MZW92_65160 [Comamonadaceae bacterium]|nr:hypothetical protein [Comamonadaceae bacterium]
MMYAARRGLRRRSVRRFGRRLAGERGDGAVALAGQAHPRRGARRRRHRGGAVGARRHRPGAGRRAASPGC